MKYNGKTVNKYASLIILVMAAVCPAAQAGTVNEDNGANAICARSSGAIDAFIAEMKFLKKKMSTPEDKQAVQDRIDEAKYCQTHRQETDNYLRKADGMQFLHQ